MLTFNKAAHWQNIYSTKQFTEVSWYQPVPQVSLDFLTKFDIAKDASIIDIGGGDSFFVDNLIDLGYSNVSILDISEKAIERAKTRLGEKADKVNWIVSDVTELKTNINFDFWHDRAAFHFLNTSEDIQKYITLASELIKPNGIFVIGTFSEQGPTKCSGIDITQYSEEKLTKLFEQNFDKIDCFTHNHTTPSGSIQNFIFCSFRKR